MASLSQTLLDATSNTQPLASPKLLSPHLSMDPSGTSSSLSSSSSASAHATTQNLSDHHLNLWLQHKPPHMLQQMQPHINIPSVQFHPQQSTASVISPSSFIHHGISSPFYDSYSNATGDSCIDHGFTGGDSPLLTSSWEALDRLVSASMMPTGSGTDHPPTEFPGLAEYGSIQHARTALQSPSSASEVLDQKPLSSIYGSYIEKSNAWAGISNQGNASSTTTPTTSASNVGLNLASLISADPGFVERAAKFSSYSQQINSQAYSSLSPSYTSNACRADYTDERARGIKKPINYNISTISNHITQSTSPNAVGLRPHADAKKDLILSTSTISHNKPSMNATANKQSTSPQASTVNLSGSKKKRETSIKDGEVDDSGADSSRKRAKGGEEEEDASNGSNISGRLNGKANKSAKAAIASIGKPKLIGRSTNSGESEQKSEVCNNKTSTPLPSPSPSPPPKPDFIHVRARRGQATDSHSLAERVRREKISERMKYLQDLVPGCTKVTGKAMMLDEIINYVQSLQRQVEFLSMKLAAVHPSKLEFNFESLFGKEVVQQPTLPNNLTVSLLSPLQLAAETATAMNSSSFLHEHVQRLQQHTLAFSESTNLPSSGIQSSFGSDASLRRTLSMLAAASSDNFGECISQISDAWVDDDLRNIMPLGSLSQSSLNLHTSLQGTSSLIHGQMKTEL